MILLFASVNIFVVTLFMLVNKPRFENNIDIFFQQMLISKRLAIDLLICTLTL